MQAQKADLAKAVLEGGSSQRLRFDETDPDPQPVCRRICDSSVAQPHLPPRTRGRRLCQQGEKDMDTYSVPSTDTSSARQTTTTPWCRLPDPLGGMPLRLYRHKPGCLPWQGMKSSTVFAYQRVAKYATAMWHNEFVPFAQYA